MTIESQTNNQANPSEEAIRVSLDSFWDYIQFVHNHEELIFKRIANCYGREGMAFGLFKSDGTQVGKSFCRVDRFEGQAWYLDDVQTFPEFKGQGYGTPLLDQTCEALWRRNLKDIVLERPGNSIAPDGFDRKSWYENHGFEPHPDPELTFMWRQAPSNSHNTDYGKRIRQVKIVIEKHSDGYVAYPIGMIGAVVGQGDSYEEALTDVTSAIACYIKEFGTAMLEDLPSIELLVAEAGVAV